MKTRINYLKLLFAALMCMLTGQVMAYDLAIANGDGVTIYYNYINDGRELEVTYKVRGDGYQNHPDYMPANHESGYAKPNIKVINVPEDVTYMGRSRKVTAIGDFAFCRADSDTLMSIVEVTLPRSIKSVGIGAFARIDSLRRVQGFEYASSLMYNIFYRCSNLEEIKLSDELTELPGGTFHLCTSLKEVIVPDNVKKVGNSAFQGCSALQKVSLPKGLKSIGSDAFKWCSSLSDIALPDSLVEIGFTAFSSCSSIKSIKIPSSLTFTLNGTVAWGVFNSCSGLETVELPEGLTNIPNETFLQCTSLSSIKLPSTIETIGRRAFYRCSALTSFEIPAKVQVLEEQTFVLSGLTSIVIPPTVKTIKNDCFHGCFKLDSVEFCEGLEEIGPNAFAMDNLTWPEYKIRAVELPSTLKVLGDGAFARNINLNAVTFYGPTELGDGIFEHCTNLTTVSSYTDEPKAFHGFGEEKMGFTQDQFYNVTLQIPYGTTETYKATNGWKDFIWVDEVEPTGIAKLPTDGGQRKGSQATYDLQGRKLSGSKGLKGIHIVGGKKILER